MEGIATQSVDSLSYDELCSLIKQPIDICASLFLSVRRAAPGQQHNVTRLEHMLRQAEELLHARGLSAAAARDLLAPARQLADEGGFWAHQGAGLALFVGPGLFRAYRLPCAFEDLVIADERLQIVPLLPMLQGDGRFYVLELGLDGVRLWCASHYGLSAVPLPGVPASLEDALKYDEFGKQGQFHPGIAGRGGERGAIFHGQGARDDQLAKEEIARYFKQVDHGVHATLHGEHAPLVLAGLGYQVSIYRAANSYPHLVEAGILCNPSILSRADLHAQAWALVAPQFDRERAAAVERYRLLAGTQPAQATNYLRAIVPAASAGRVATLFVAAGQRRWGRFEAASGALALHEAAEPRDTELVNFAATHTILNGGAVYIVTPAQLPEADSLAAMFRY